MFLAEKGAASNNTPSRCHNSGQGDIGSERASGGEEVKQSGAIQRNSLGLAVLELKK